MSLPMLLAMETYTKKIRMTPRSSCVWNLSDDTNTIKLVVNKTHFGTRGITKVNWG